VADSFIGGGNQSTRRKPQTCCKSLTNLITLSMKFTKIRIQRIYRNSVRFKVDRFWFHWIFYFHCNRGYEKKMSEWVSDCVKVKPSKNFGTLPLICESISSISVGCICFRNKMTQKGLDSYPTFHDFCSYRWNSRKLESNEYIGIQWDSKLIDSDFIESFIFIAAEVMKKKWVNEWVIVV
jgi:hypothetical protein